MPFSHQTSGGLGMECGNTRIELKGNALTFERAL